MCRAPFSTVFMAALLGASFSAPAHNSADSSMAPVAVASIHRSSALDHLGTDKASRSNTVLTPRQDPASSQIISSDYLDVVRVAPSPAPNPTATTQIHSGWRYTAALLGTLGIIGTIAVRRRKPGKPRA